MPEPAEVLAIIPARGGSKSIPGKNIRPIADKPLICHTIQHALSSRLVSRTVVSTDDSEIARVSQECGAEVIDRPAELATDTASSEVALLNVLETLEKEGYVPDIIVFLQCTSPIRTLSDIDNALGQFADEKLDSLLSVCKSHRFLWRVKDDQAEPINYEYRDRKPRQLLPPEFEENGSFYICRREILTEGKNRLGGRIGLYEMPRRASLEIDDELDFYLIEQLMENR